MQLEGQLEALAGFKKHFSKQAFMKHFSLSYDRRPKGESRVIV